jgi:hypothetical protein
MKPGGTLIKSLVISPKVTASRCSHTASSAQPSTKVVPGSRMCQK